MKNSAFLLPTFFCIFFVSSILASPKLSIYDPLGALGNEERVKLEAEGQALITSRKVNGQDVLIQIDFLSKHEFEEGGITGRDAEGRTLFSLGTYANWSARYFSGPAVLMLFLDQGDGTYVLDALNFSDMLMDEGIPDLVRRYIRDEIMRKETGYEAIISSGLYAIGEALNPVYRERLERKGNEMLNTDKRYQRAHCNHWSDCKYYEYYPIERLASSFPKNTDFSDLSVFIETPPGYLATDLVKKTQEKVLDWGYTHASEKVSNWPWENSGKYLKTSSNTVGYIIPNDYYPIKNNGDTLSFLDIEIEQKSNGELLPVMGYLQIHGWKATYCNFFAYDLSNHIFGHVPWGRPKKANDIHTYISSNPDIFVDVPIDIKDGKVFAQKGYPVYYTLLGDLRPDGTRKPGHIATGWVESNMIIQAGRNTGIMLLTKAFVDLAKVSVHIYLGHLKRPL